VGEVILLLPLSFLVGAIPFANLAARWRAGVDLRTVGTGTVSGSSLYRTTGFGALVVAGLLDVAKGTVGPMLAGAGRPVLAGVAGGLAVTGHNWSIFLRGAGGRGVATAMGALAVQAWPGVVVILLALAVGRLAGRTGVATFIGLLVLGPLLALLGGPADGFAAACVAVPIMVKRLTGNEPPPPQARAQVLRHRLLYDNDGGLAG
jgi:glycerol-3-phosphate acyltransferase PlsY